MILRLIILFVLSFNLSAQSGLSLSQMNQSSNAQTKLNQFPLYKNVKQKEVISATINPESFIVGPGDIFMVDIVTSNLVNQFELIISITGELIIPMVGKINIADSSLSDAINLIEDSFKKQYSDAQLSIMLKDAGNYNLYVKNPYGLNDEYKVNSLMRVSDLFESVIANIKKHNYDIANISNRNVKITNSSGDNYYDLGMFYAEGDYSNNPYINRGDQIEFNLVNDFVEVWGGVAKKGKYEFLPNDHLDDIIKLAGGLLESAYRDSLIITRSINGKREHIFVDSMKMKTFELYDNDIINIKDKNRNLFKQVAFISGEVIFPGFYNIDNSITSINQLIDLAGGFTEEANQDLVMIENQPNHEFDMTNIVNKPPEYITESDISFVDVGIDYHLNSKSIVNKNEFLNYKLMNGDEINVLPKINFIEIVGAVNRPGKYPYNENFTILDYINLAGGKKRNSLNNTYLIEQGSVVKKIVKKNQSLNGGDVIFIPYDLEINRWTRFKDWMTVSGQVAAFIVLIQNIIGGT
mgnify:FL=1|tara:strand:- start:780 stop:2348 length:1569 start_codon:yes stop_codon:yes gene_type:complete